MSSLWLVRLVCGWFVGGLTGLTANGLFLPVERVGGTF